MQKDELRYLDLYKQIEEGNTPGEIEKLEERQRILKQLAAEVRWNEERSDELMTLAIGTKCTRTRTSAQHPPPSPTTAILPTTRPNPFCDSLRISQPDWVNYAAGFSASCVSTLVMHPLDTVKTRLMSKKKSSPDNISPLPPSSTSLSSATLLSSTSPDDEPNFDIGSLYEGLFANMLKEAPASALYLGLYESAMVFLSQFGFFQEYPLISYLLAGAIGELVGSMIRAPAEAVKTRLQTGNRTFPEAVSDTFGPGERAGGAKRCLLFSNLPLGSLRSSHN